MASPVTRIGDYSIGEAPCFTPTPLIEDCSPNVLVNGRAVGRLGSGFEPHTSTCLRPQITHKIRVVSSASNTVLVNNRFIARQGDDISCGDVIAEGSSNVLAG